MEPTKGGRFEPGQSGNPSGRPKGSRNRATQALELILDGDAETILRAVMAHALGGDPTAMKLCLDRLMPARKDRPVTFDLPPIKTVADLPKATAALAQAVADGEISPAEAAAIGQVLAAHAKAIETHELAERVAELEARTAGGGER